MSGMEKNVRKENIDNNKKYNIPAHICVNTPAGASFRARFLSLKDA